MPKTKETKAIARRIDITYHRRPHWFRWWRRFLVVVVALATGAGAAYMGTGRADHMLNPGPVTQAHAGFENNCAKCHDHDAKGGFFKTVSDNACLACHQSAPIHHPNADLNPGNPSAPHLAGMDAHGGKLRSADCVASTRARSG